MLWFPVRVGPFNQCLGASMLEQASQHPCPYAMPWEAEGAVLPELVSDTKM